MKQITCKSGIKGGQAKLQDIYGRLEEFDEYYEVYNLGERLGLKSAKEAWDANPLIEGSTDPEDFRVSDSEPLEQEQTGELFTSGQWGIIDDNHPNKLHICPIDAGGVIASITFTDDSKKEAEANARLICESKRLFYMVKELVNHFGEESETKFSDKNKAIQEATEILNRIGKNS